MKLKHTTFILKKGNTYLSPKKNKATLLDHRETYRPMIYPWGYEYYKQQSQLHWLPAEVPMQNDVDDWKHKIIPEEKQLLTQIFRFFTQADVCVAEGYAKYYLPYLGGHPEVAMMLHTFAAMEAIHVDSYSLLIDTVGMPEAEYQAFGKYKAMMDKNVYMKSMKMDTVQDILRTIATYSAFGEGMQLFASFAILMNFPRFGKMKGMGQIVTYSIRDESIHVDGMLQVFKTLVKEHKEVWVDGFKKELYDIARSMVALEDAFIDLAFELGGIEGLDKEDVKKYIRYIADRRLLQMGLKTEFKVKENPLPWLEEMLNSQEHGNFFETRVTEYKKSAISGDWSKDVWKKV
jgi:ribonucleoside-diphosphate reductase beta chain